jgi:hypothetical protein
MNGRGQVADFSKSRSNRLGRALCFRQEDAGGFLDDHARESTCASAEDSAARCIVAHEEQRCRRHRFGRQQRQHCFGHQSFRHAGGRRGTQRIDADVVLRAFDLQHVHQSDQAGLGGTVVCLPEVAVDAGGRCRHQDAAEVRRAHVRPYGLAADRRTQQVHVEHRAEIGQRRLGETGVAQDAGIVDEDVDAAPALDHGCDHVRNLLGIGDACAMRHRLATRLPDFCGHALSGLG